MSQKLEEVDQGLQRGYMSVFLITYALKAQGSRPGASRGIYEYIAYLEQVPVQAL